MATVILLSLEDEKSARNAFGTVQELHQSALMRIAGAALVDIGKDGHLLMETTAHDPVTPLDMTESAVFGLVLGSILCTPQFGFAVGGTLAAVIEKHEQQDDTVDQLFRDQISKAVRPGRWAIIVYASEVADDEVKRQLQSSRGEFFSIDLDEEDEAKLAREVGIEG
jgi:uncharacterized membrane protein